MRDINVQIEHCGCQYGLYLSVIDLPLQPSLLTVTLRSPVFREGYLTLQVCPDWKAVTPSVKSDLFIDSNEMRLALILLERAWELIQARLKNEIKQRKADEMRLRKTPA